MDESRTTVAPELDGRERCERSGLVLFNERNGSVDPRSTLQLTSQNIGDCIPYGITCNGGMYAIVRAQ